ncbi:hypothetical protein WME79_31540 [Sorangium sp. So ce726]|uniref:hypothetical protein n=1 Tax=Sorangium sp. So ce726 TaxID=3133319 RepID=UPI003F63E2D4
MRQENSRRPYMSVGAPHGRATISTAIECIVQRAKAALELARSRRKVGARLTLSFDEARDRVNQ